MNRILATFSAAALIAVAASAQCGTFAATGTFVGNGDDSVFATHYALGFPYTMAGSAGTTTWTHVRISSNGWLCLTDGLTATSIPGGTSYGSVAAASASSLYGPAGSNPRLAPYWGDLNSTGTNGIYFDNTSNPGVSAKVTWFNVVYFGNAVTKSFSVEIFASGLIKYSYSPGMNFNSGGSKYVGLSCSNGLAVPAASDFVPGPAASAVGAMHQAFTTTGSLDVGGRILDFVPAGAGWNEQVTCTYQSASHTSYGSGCYTISDSVYESFPTAAAMAAVLEWKAITFTPSAGSYLVASGGGLLPVGSVQAVPTIVANGDDTTQTVPFTVATFPGSTGLAICSNGFVSLAAGNGSGFSPSVATFLADAQTSFRSWHDMNPTIVGSGQIKYEESAALAMVTYDGVWDFGGTSAADASTIQFQFYPSGVVVIAWGALSQLGASGTGYLVGYSPGGPSVNGGSIDLVTALPYQVASTNLNAMALSATPAPVSTAGSGTLVTYTQSNIPEAVPTSGVYFGITILSLGQDLPGTDLGFLRMPGCKLHITSLDVTTAFVGATNSQTTQFQVPAGVPYGFQLFAQSAAMIAPGSLPNGQNAFGATLSNAVASFISTL